MWTGVLFAGLLACATNGAKVPDWLVTQIDTPTTLTNSSRGTLVLSNGLIYREFTLTPGFGTMDFYSFREKSSALRAINPEAIIALGKSYSFFCRPLTLSYSANYLQLKTITKRVFYQLFALLISKGSLVNPTLKPCI